MNLSILSLSEVEVHCTARDARCTLFLRVVTRRERRDRVLSELRPSFLLDTLSETRRSRLSGKVLQYFEKFRNLVFGLLRGGVNADEVDGFGVCDEFDVVKICNGVDQNLKDVIVNGAR